MATNVKEVGIFAILAGIAWFFLGGDSDGETKSLSGLKGYSDDIDKDAARELELYTENDSQLYTQQHLPIIKNLARKIYNGKYEYITDYVQKGKQLPNGELKNRIMIIGNKYNIFT